jgi:hypothetical protein
MNINNMIVYICDYCYNDIHNKGRDIEILTGNNFGRATCALCDNIGKHCTTWGELLYLLKRLLND